MPVIAKQANRFGARSMGKSPDVTVKAHFILFFEGVTGRAFYFLGFTYSVQQNLDSRLDSRSLYFPSLLA
jgi:hypothetical protein